MQISLTQESADSIVQMHNNAIRVLKEIISKVNALVDEFKVELTKYKQGLRWYQKGSFNGRFYFHVSALEEQLQQLKTSSRQVLICCSENVESLIDSETTHYLTKYCAMTQTDIDAYIGTTYGVVASAIHSLKTGGFDANHPVMQTFFLHHP